MNIVATLDRATEGNVLIGGVKTVGDKLSNKEAYQKKRIFRFVFQDFNLLDLSFSNRDNIYLPLVLSGVKPRQLNERIGEIAPILGISKLLDKFPSEISGGQNKELLSQEL